MNKLMIIGNLTNKPELRTTQQGVNVTSFTVAVNRRRAQGAEPQADFFRVSAWRWLAENCAKYLDKGRKVAVTGQVSVSTYTTNGGETRAALEVTADDVEFLSPKAETQPAQPTANAVQPAPSGYVEVDDNQLPF
jgi:single-strand DNA-binding protein